MYPIYLTPQDFHLYAPYESEHRLSERYGFSVQTIRRMRREEGIDLSKKKQFRPMPDNFTDLAKDMTITEASRFWRTSRAIARRWFEETGIKPASPTRVEQRDTFMPVAEEADMTLAGQAALYLQKFSPVYRKGNMWVRGSKRLTDAEIIEIANSKKERDRRLA